MSLTQNVAFCGCFFFFLSPSWKTKERMEEGKGVGRERVKKKKKRSSKSIISSRTQYQIVFPEAMRAKDEKSEC